MLQLRPRSPASRLPALRTTDAFGTTRSRATTTSHVPPPTCTPVQDVSAEGANQSVTGTAVDNTGKNWLERKRTVGHTDRATLWLRRGLRGGGRETRSKAGRRRNASPSTFRAARRAKKASRAAARTLAGAQDGLERPKRRTSARLRRSQLRMRRGCLPGRRSQPPVPGY
jgi:hypothetical protein